jgi:hypothetical protein
MIYIFRSKEYQQYREAVEHQDNIEYFCYKVKQPDLVYAVQDDKQAAELAVELPKDQAWSADVAGWVFEHHHDPAIQEMVDPEGAATLLFVGRDHLTNPEKLREHIEAAYRAYETGNTVSVDEIFKDRDRQRNQKPESGTQ